MAYSKSHLEKLAGCQLAQWQVDAVNTILESRSRGVASRFGVQYGRGVVARLVGQLRES